MAWVPEALSSSCLHTRIGAEYMSGSKWRIVLT
jgi:hypothetical protein